MITGLAAELVSTVFGTNRTHVIERMVQAGVKVCESASDAPSARELAGLLQADYDRLHTFHEMGNAKSKEYAVALTDARSHLLMVAYVAPQTLEDSFRLRRVPLVPLDETAHNPFTVARDPSRYLGKEEGCPNCGNRDKDQFSWGEDGTHEEWERTCIACYHVMRG